MSAPRFRLALILSGLAVATIVHLLPLWGVLSAANLERLYGVPIEGNDLQLLMRHRAVLFGALGGFTLVAMFRPALRTPALALAFASLAAFLVLSWLIGPQSAEVARVATVDLFAAPIVGAALVASLRVSP